MRKRGLLIHVVGPDGVGKSTLALAIADALSADRPVRHVYWRPGLLPSPRSLLGRPDDQVVTDPHGREAQGIARGMTRLLYYALDFILGHYILYGPTLRRGGAVIVERGWDDLLVDPRRYLLQTVPAAGARILRPLIPSPDIVLLLAARPATIRARKDELQSSEIARQIESWRNTVRARSATMELNAEEPVDQVVAAAMQIVNRAKPGRGGHE
jgi:thymidylate kinase